MHNKDTTVNLFGEVVPIPVLQVTGKPKRSNEAKGYPAPKGSGPQGETCRSCQHATCVPAYSKNYWKCGLLRASWTKGLGSDIRLKAAACRHWEAKP